MPEGARTWVKDIMRTGRIALASEPSLTGPSLNTKQAHAVNIVRQHDLQLQAYRDHRARTGEMHPGQAVEPPEPLRVIMAGTAGTGKTVVINEMLRTVSAEKFKLLAPTGNAACGIGGQVRSTFKTCNADLGYVHSHNVLANVTCLCGR